MPTEVHESVWRRKRDRLARSGALILVQPELRLIAAWGIQKCGYVMIFALRVGAAATAYPMCPRPDRSRIARSHCR